LFIISLPDCREMAIILNNISFKNQSPIQALL
jgi:hypothetical protein